VPQMLRFQILHRRSTHAYRTAAVLLLAAGIGWIVTLPSPRRKDPETDAG
jgi:hypothetical protein